MLRKSLGVPFTAALLLLWSLAGSAHATAIADAVAIANLMVEGIENLSSDVQITGELDIVDAFADSIGNADGSFEGSDASLIPDPGDASRVAGIQLAAVTEAEAEGGFGVGAFFPTGTLSFVNTSSTMSYDIMLSLDYILNSIVSVDNPGREFALALSFIDFGSPGGDFEQELLADSELGPTLLVDADFLGFGFTLGAQSSADVFLGVGAAAVADAPEPATFGLIAFGVVAAIARRRK